MFVPCFAVVHTSTRLYQQSRQCWWRRNAKCIRPGWRSLSPFPPGWSTSLPRIQQIVGNGCVTSSQKYAISCTEHSSCSSQNVFCLVRLRLCNSVALWHRGLDAECVHRHEKEKLNAINSCWKMLHYYGKILATIDNSMVVNIDSV